MKSSFAWLSCLLCGALGIGCAATLEKVIIEPSCDARVGARVVIDGEFEGIEGAAVLLAAATKNPQHEFIGLDRQGVPIGENVLDTLATGSAAADQTLYSSALPYMAWYVAFIDVDGDGALSAGEPMGVDPGNPHPGNCDPNSIGIAIDRVRKP